MLILGTANNFKNIDPDFEKRKYMGRKYERESDGVIVHEKRCNICGKIFNYEITIEKVKEYVLQGRWDHTNSEVTHCGNSTCSDWEVDRFTHLKRVNQQKTDETMAILNSPEVQEMYRKKLLEGAVA